MHPPIAAPHRSLDRDGPIHRRRGAAEGRRLKRPREHHEIEGPASRLLLLKPTFSSGDATLLQHSDIPIEGVGVVHVITEVCHDDLGYAFSDVTLQRYADGKMAEPTALTGSVCESPVALFMHEHWCDLERLINCVRGDSKALCILDIDWDLPAADDVDEPDAPQCSEPPSPRVGALIARAESRLVRTSRASSACTAPPR